ncbi:MAG: TonB family protein [Rhizomicrobium sp.]
MERPSHLILDTQARCFSCRLPYVGLAISLQCVVFSMFIYGLANHTIADIIRDIEVPPIQKLEVETRVQPPEPTITKKVPTETPIPPIFTTEKAPGGNSITLLRPTSDDPQAARGFDRPLASVAGTHTVPPYPPIARRSGAEGKVTLRLTVSAEGKVTAAEVVSSSGRDDMDKGAQQWIMAHWAYKPALDNGVPVAGHMLASVIFSLTNEH